MSRTYRRKNQKHDYKWVLHDWDYCPYYRRCFAVEIDPKSQQGKKALARYHSDAAHGSYPGITAPHWYRRMLNKKATAKEKQQIHRFIKYVDYEVPKPKRVSDASWYW